MGQDTYYYKDFNVVNKIWWHQYASALYDAWTNANYLRKGCVANTNAALTFKIPVYNNRPATAAPHPDSGKTTTGDIEIDESNLPVASEWSIKLNETGVFSLKPTYFLGEYSIYDIVVTDKNNNEISMNITDKVACVTVGNDLIVEEEGNVETTLKEAGITVSNANELKVVHNINNSGMITSNRNFVVGNDFIITAKGMLDSNGIANGTPNTVGNNFELSGKATFANYTTTIVNKVFNSEAKSEFIREGISGTVYRATVNVGTIGKTDGTAQGGWPTQM